MSSSSHSWASQSDVWRKLGGTVGDPASLFSLLIPPGCSVSEILEALEAEHALASASPSELRQETMRVIAEAKECLESYDEIPARGLVIFTGRSNDGDHLECFFEPNEPITTYLCLCDDTFHLPKTNTYTGS